MGTGQCRSIRHKDARLAFNPQLVCTINWADSGPGYSWPESYHVTYLPGFDRFVMTASRDGPDAWGCVDQAIGVADGSLSPVEAARQASLRQRSLNVMQKRLLPVDEQALLKAYVEGSEPADAAAIYDALEVPHDAMPPRPQSEEDLR